MSESQRFKRKESIESVGRGDAARVHDDERRLGEPVKRWAHSDGMTRLFVGAFAAAA